VAAVFVLGAAGCGGSGSGQAPTGPAAAKKPCPIYPVQHALQTCRSPDGRWVVSLRYERSSSVCKLSSSQGKSWKPTWTFRQGGNSCTQETWVKPHLLLVQDGATLVDRLDPATRTTTPLAQLSPFFVSPNGQWIGGDVSGGPQVSSAAYVLSLHSRACLVVPRNARQTERVAGFTLDSKNVIADRAPFNPNNPRTGHDVQFALSSLRSGCPTGPDGVLPAKS
jgi:hypothetical protein